MSPSSFCSRVSSECDGPGGGNADKSADGGAEADGEDAMGVAVMWLPFRRSKKSATAPPRRRGVSPPAAAAFAPPSPPPPPPRAAAARNARRASASPRRRAASARAGPNTASYSASTSAGGAACSVSDDVLKPAPRTSGPSAPRWIARSASVRSRAVRTVHRAACGTR